MRVALEELKPLDDWQSVLFSSRLQRESNLLAASSLPKLQIGKQELGLSNVARAIRSAGVQSE